MWYRSPMKISYYLRWWIIYTNHMIRKKKFLSMEQNESIEELIGFVNCFWGSLLGQYQ